MAKEVEFIEWLEDRLDLSDEPRKDFLDNAIHAHYLFNNDLERWIPGTEEPIDTNDGHPVSTDNMIQPMLLDAVSLLLKNYPMFRIKPTKASDFDLTDEINKHINAAWASSEAQRMLSISQLTALMLGLSILEVTPSWNTMGEVSIDISVVPLSDVWVDPKQIDIDKSWVVRRTWHTERELEIDWGKKEIDKALNYYPAHALQNASAEEEVFPDWWSHVDDQIPLFTVWLRPEDLDPDIFTNQEIIDSPYGRKIEIINQKIVRNVPNPFAIAAAGADGEPTWVGHKTHPFVTHECNRIIDEYGYSGFYDVRGLVTSMESSQWELNELSRILMQIGRRSAQPVVIAPEGSLTDPTSNITYTAGKVIQFDPSISPSPPTAVPLPTDAGYLQYLHSQRKSTLREQSGIREFMTGGGQAPGTSHTPAGTIASVQETSFTRMWTIVAALDRAIQGVAKRMLGLMQEFYDVGKFVATSEKGDQWFGEWQESHVENEFNVEVISGMSTPLRDIDRVNTATQVYQAIAPVVQLGSMPQNMSSLMLVKAYLQTINEPAAFEYLNLVNTMLEELERQERAQQQAQEQQALMQQQQQMQQQGNGLPPEGSIEEPIEADQLPLPEMEV